MHVALYQPDIAQNTAAIARTAVCLRATLHIVGPAGFDLSQRAVRRAGLDYLESATIERHLTFHAFRAAQRRIILFTTAGAVPLQDAPFRPGDTLLFGRETAGVPPQVHDAVDLRVKIPIVGRSLNLASAVAIGLWHARMTTNTVEAT
ncbi:MAG: tRNA (cytidine(34)-2'-O)-methyltransferase [Pseudomonadota bacterium]